MKRCRKSYMKSCTKSCNKSCTKSCMESCMKSCMKRLMNEMYFETYPQSIKLSYQLISWDFEYIFYFSYVMLLNILTVCILFHVFSIDFRNFGWYLEQTFTMFVNFYLKFTCMLDNFYEICHLVIHLYDVF